MVLNRSEKQNTFYCFSNPFCKQAISVLAPQKEQLRKRAGSYLLLSAVTVKGPAQQLHTISPFLSFFKLPSADQTELAGLVGRNPSP